MPLLEDGTIDRFDWYTMPHCNGGSFRPLLARTGADTATGLRVTADVAAGLDTVYQRGIVHRDV
ncbi:hypothetical protein SRB5_06890 [Streptomyces sp. RB5]|uniref:Protein kinase domain-containing protein n=1 Tax=Streptomyces smaragdinus TaxID=2585196 RepID=A0A7K0CAY9_9ACTN|nr:hypothetical protein [Streptomyces smaragdinus]MQY10578.1 hypothetical protein [Streptomyces smaragdinus]